MALIKPEVQKILRAAGLERPEKADDLYVHQHLNNTGLSNERIAEELTSLAINSGSDHLRLRAIETALKVKGALRDVTPVAPNFTIIIQNSGQDFNRTNGINPIIFPRQSLNFVSPSEVVEEQEPEEELEENEEEEPEEQHEEES